MGKKKKSPKRSSQPKVESTIEIKLPSDLYNRVMAVKATDQKFLDDTVRAVFGHDGEYDMTHVVFTQGTLKAADINKLKKKDSDLSRKAGYWKLCEG